MASHSEEAVRQMWLRLQRDDQHRDSSAPLLETFGRLLGEMATRERRARSEQETLETALRHQQETMQSQVRHETMQSRVRLSGDKAK